MKKTIYYAFVFAAMSLLIIACRKDEDGETSSNGGKAPSAVKAVDLDLPSGTLWATMNVGANSPEEYGNYYAWGETKAYGEEDVSNSQNYSFAGSYKKEWYDWNTLKWCNDTEGYSFSKYGIVDNKKVLELADDAAYVNWGKNWRMPTNAEIQELRDNCTWTWTFKNNVKGYKVSSKIDSSKYIFLPAAGYRDESSLHNAGSDGYYWSSSIYENYSHLQWCLIFFDYHIYDTENMRCRGLCVRPVRRQ